MIEIPLTQGQVAIVDDVDAHLLQLNWFAEKREQTYYACRNKPKIHGKRQGLIRLHTAVMGQPPAEMEIDHINGNGLDNRRCNLRIATKAQNATNKRASRTKERTTYKGVFWHKPQNRWQAQITSNQKIHWLGSFDTAEAGARAYDAAAREMFGEYAKLNFP